jgi:hypothetical protein
MMRRLLAKSPSDEARESAAVRAARKGNREAMDWVSRARRDQLEREYQARVGESRDRAAALLRDELRPCPAPGCCVHCSRPQAGCTCAPGRFIAFCPEDS